MKVTIFSIIISFGFLSNCNNSSYYDKKKHVIKHPNLKAKYRKNIDYAFRLFYHTLPRKEYEAKVVKHKKSFPSTVTYDYDQSFVTYSASSTKKKLNLTPNDNLYIFQHKVKYAKMIGDDKYIANEFIRFLYDSIKRDKNPDIQKLGAKLFSDYE